MMQNMKRGLSDNIGIVDEASKVAVGSVLGVAMLLADVVKRWYR